MFKPVQSLQRGLALIDAISQRRDGAFLKDLAAEIGCSAPAAYHLVQTLAHAGYVQRLENPARYVLGPRLLQLIDNQQQDRFYQVVHQHMRHLCSQLPGSSIYLSEYVGQSVVVQARIQHPHTELLQRDLRHVLPPYTSAGSLAHLTYWPQEVRDQYQAHYPFATYGQAFWGDMSAMQAAMDQLREQGCYLMPEPRATALKLALPVLRPGGSLAAAMTVQWNQTSRQGLAAKKKTLIAAALATAEQITQELAERTQR